MRCMKHGFLAAKLSSKPASIPRNQGSHLPQVRRETKFGTLNEMLAKYGDTEEAMRKLIEPGFYIKNYLVQGEFDST